ncbi:MAG: ATP-dependent Clp protease ATP-binding subunit [Actinomycetota bacterium]|nr:ATP-dependent Clp protease ATP-binding subunit [Actinomycetota bacterium]
MPKINVYLSDELARAVREVDLPVSSVCQRALADAVAAADGPVIDGEGGPGAPFAGELSRFTRRARVAIDHARSTRARPTSLDLVQGLLTEGNNLALGVLRALEVEPDDLLAKLHSRNRQHGARPGGIPDVLERSTQQALELGHNYVGCEHLLLGLAAGPEGELAAETLQAMGVDAIRGRQAVGMMLAGFAYARDNGVHAGLSTSIRSALDEIRARLSRLESR